MLPPHTCISTKAENWVLKLNMHVCSKALRRKEGEEEEEKEEGEKEEEKEEEKAENEEEEESRDAYPGDCICSRLYFSGSTSGKAPLLNF